MDVIEFVSPENETASGRRKRDDDSVLNELNDERRTNELEKEREAKEKLIQNSLDPPARL